MRSSISIPTSSQPTSLASASNDDLLVVAAGEDVEILSSSGGKKLSARSFKGDKALSVAAANIAGSLHVAVGLEVS